MLAFYMTLIEDDQDKDKFTVIYQTYAASLIKIADHILNDYALAEDAVHETFLYVLKILRNIKDPLSPQTKVLVEKTVIHISLDLCRSRQTNLKKVREFTEEDSNILPTTQDIAEELEKKHQHNRIKQYILELSQEDRELLSLYYFSKVPAKQIALLLNVTKKTVYNRLSKIIHTLQKRLREEDLLD